MSHDVAIGAVPLYTQLDRIDRSLAGAGIGPADPVPPELLFPLDQWHYHGVQAVRDAAQRLGLGPSSAVLEVGSGIGGPARALAHAAGCRVTALELQPAVHAVGVDLTRRTGLADRVTHICGDALAYPLPEGTFDAVVSWLAILHIPHRPTLLARLGRALRPGGTLYVEDLFMRAPFSDRDGRDLRDLVFGVSVTSLEDYAGELGKARFVDIETIDMTEDWAEFARKRLAAWRENRASHVAVQGEDAFAAQETFYAVIARLFDGGSLGGVRVTARVP